MKICKLKPAVVQVSFDLLNEILQSHNLKILIKIQRGFLNFIFVKNWKICRGGSMTKGFFLIFPDSTMHEWPLMSSPVPVVAILAVYLLFVLKIGPKLMENRKPYNLKNILIGYNAYQVGFSLWMCATVSISWRFIPSKTDFWSHPFYRAFETSTS